MNNETSVNVTFEDTTPTSSVAADPQDIDPGQWLTATSGLVTGFVQTRAGRLKIAALTEKEADMIRKSSESMVPGNPRQRQTSIKKLRLSTVAASVNKAYGYVVGNPSFLTPDKLESALSGELTMIIAEISKLSGFAEEDQGQNPGDFLQVS
jgi:hypothetical protein